MSCYIFVPDTFRQKQSSRLLQQYILNDFVSSLAFYFAFVLPMHFSLLLVCDDFMSQPPQCYNDSQWKVFLVGGFQKSYDKTDYGRMAPPSTGRFFIDFWVPNSEQHTCYGTDIKHTIEWNIRGKEWVRERDRMTKRWSLLNWFSVWTGDGTHKHTQTIPNRDTGWSNLVQLQQPLQQAERVGYEPTTYWALLYTKQLRVDVTNKFQQS